MVSIYHPVWFHRHLHRLLRFHRCSVVVVQVVAVVVIVAAPAAPAATRSPKLTMHMVFVQFNMVIISYVVAASMYKITHDTL